MRPASISDRTPFSLDLETTGLQPYRGDTIISFALSNEAFTTYYDLRDPAEESPMEIVLGVLANPNNLVFIHNAKFDLHFVRAWARKHSYDFKLNALILDTQVMARLVDNSKLRYGLNDVADWFHLKKDDRVAEWIKKNKAYRIVSNEDTGDSEKIPDFNQVPKDMLHEYCMTDASICLEIGKKLLIELDSLDSGYLATLSIKKSVYDVLLVESECTKVLLGMEANGVLLNESLAQRALRSEFANIKAARAEFEQLTGKAFIDSGKSLVEAFRAFPDDFTRIQFTEKGNPTFTDEILHTFNNPIAGIVKRHREASKKASSFYGNFIKLRGEDGRIHTNFRQAGTTSGRMSCIARGQLVQVPGGEIAIEKIKPGDLVYCYSGSGELCLSKVKRVMNNGYQNCLRLKFQSSGDGRIIHLECTPDHLIKTKKYGWIRADKINRYTKVYHVRRSLMPSGRIRIYGTDKLMRLEENIIKEKVFNAPSHMHIHHIDEDKSNNSIDNLTVCNSVAHNRLHSMLRGRIIGNGVKVSRSYSKFSLLRKLAAAKGRATFIDNDFSSFKRWCSIHGISIKEVRSRYSANGIYLSRSNVLSAIHDKNIYEASSYLGVGHIKLKKLCLKYGFTYNHMFHSREILGIREVFDLEVEDNHCFIASEICVHNCSDPNLQQVSKGADKGKDDDQKVRACFIPDPDSLWLSIDYQAQEYRMLLDLAGEIPVIEAIKGGLDVHTATAQMMGVSRQEAKTINFLLLYGGGASKLASELNIPINQAQDLRNLYFSRLPKVGSFVRAVIKKAEGGLISNWAGRVYKFDRNFAYKAPNYIIQGGCADVMKRALIGCNEFLKPYHTKMMLSVHDEICFNLHKNELDIIPELQRIMTEVYPSQYLPLETEASISDKSWAHVEKYVRAPRVET